MRSLLFGFILLVAVTTPSDSFAQDSLVIPLLSFNPSEFDDKARDQKWERLTLPKKDWTEYELKTEDGRTYVRAISNNSASGWRYNIEIDPKEYPIIEWQWKVDSVLTNGDMNQKKGDDYAARIYVTYDFSRRDLPFGERVKYGAMKTFTSFDIPLRALNFVWANKAPVGTIRKNVFTNWVNMVAVESGNENAGSWIISSTNVYDTYKQAFNGEEPKKITGVAIMTDSDNSKGAATAYYGTIIFRKKK